MKDKYVTVFVVAALAGVIAIGANSYHTGRCGPSDHLPPTTNNPAGSIDDDAIVVSPLAGAHAEGGGS